MGGPEVGLAGSVRRQQIELYSSPSLFLFRSLRLSIDESGTNSRSGKQTNFSRDFMLFPITLEQTRPMEWSERQKLNRKAHSNFFFVLFFAFSF